jgi:hypothetical protein
MQSLMCGVQLVGFGAFDQVDSPGNNLYDLKFNEFFKNQMFDGNVANLNYLKECGRFKDDLDEIQIEAMKTRKISEYFKNKTASLQHDYHLTEKKTTRNEIAKIKCKSYCDKLPSDQVVCMGTCIMEWAWRLDAPITLNWISITR